MPLSEEQLIWVRSYIGDDTPPENYELDEMYDRLKAQGAVVAEVLRKRRADLLAGPLSFAVEGYSQNASGNIAALDELIDDAEADADEELGVGGVRIIQLTRDAPRR